MPKTHSPKMDYFFQYRKYAEALYEALESDPYYRLIKNTVAGSEEIKREGMLKYMDYSMKEAALYGKLFVPPEQDYGASIWSVPIPQSQQLEQKENKKTFFYEHLGKSSLEAYLKIMDFMSQQTDSLVDPDSWYLSIVGIKPAFQGQGLGEGLMKDILALADSAGVSTYLETFVARNKKFYQQLGYTEKGSFYEPTVKSEYWIMVRNQQ